MAALPDHLTLRFDEEHLARFERASDALKRKTLTGLAFDYLLQTTPCTCTNQRPDCRNHIHAPPCRIAIAIDIATGLRPWPTDDE